MTRDIADPFSRRAQAYADSPTHARDADLDIVADFATPGANDWCLDIACGAGHTALRMAEAAGQAIAADIAPGMIDAARRRATERGLANLRVQYADATALPFAPGSFDLVTCRIAAHHFPDVPAFLAEVARVLVPSGRLVMEDRLAPEDPDQAAFLEELETRRDPTHVHSLSRAQWRAATHAAGLRITRVTVFEKVHECAPWVRRTGLDEARIAQITGRILAAPSRHPGRPVRPGGRADRPFARPKTHSTRRAHRVGPIAAGLRLAPQAI